MTGQAAVYRTLRTVERRSTFPLAVACLYEAVALSFPNRYTPPITVLAHRHKWVFPVFSAVLGLHVWFAEEGAGAGQVA